jgi:hypothetical protein
VKRAPFLYGFWALREQRQVLDAHATLLQLLLLLGRDVF